MDWKNSFCLSSAWFNGILQEIHINLNGVIFCWAFSDHSPGSRQKKTKTGRRLALNSTFTSRLLIRPRSHVHVLCSGYAYPMCMICPTDRFFSLLSRDIRPCCVLNAKDSFFWANCVPGYAFPINCY